VNGASGVNDKDGTAQYLQLVTVVGPLSITEHYSCSLRFLSVMNHSDTGFNITLPHDY